MRGSKLLTTEGGKRLNWFVYVTGAFGSTDWNPGSHCGYEAPWGDLCPEECGCVISPGRMS